MLNILRKHLGFALLMAFVMGWSSVVSAQQNIMHEQMMMSHAQTETTQAENSLSESDSQHNMADCHKTVSHSATSMAHHNSNLSTNDHCHDQMLKHSQSQTDSLDHHGSINNTDCQDCALWHCQMSTTYVDTALISLQSLKISPYPNTPKFIFKGQHLKGHWQEILRPPQV
ncbi:hypothetical protein B9T33_09135 [Acinetobacter sp. ANC 5054]|uniref:hypothetical protein n=1 Tax=Acinetobacter sp. ANC 5054 TaxID=1977877 RepID=UPI000A3598A1|nr:hypothetical protein [Acinetobacter sp. ANC 5054]OTG80578.1 hypothetical protein B9T33_09135 [Acinetobacter sp. ANC 5054]